MKKSLLALAVLGAFAGVASAQSTVTLFGVVDASLRSVKNGSNDALRTMANSGLNSSRLGFRGVEDLGGGLSAGFWLEGQLNNDVGQGSGATTGYDFQRRSTVSLLGGFGEIRLGRDYTSGFWNTTIFDPFGTNGVGAFTNLSINALGTVGAASYVRSNNTVGYFLPGNLGGLYGQAQVSAQEQAAPNGNKQQSFRVGYAAGPVNIALSAQKTEAGAVDWKHNNLAGSYNLGVVNLMGQYDQQKASPREQKTYLLGAIVPLGQGEFKFAYTKADQSGGNFDSADSSQIAVGYVYNLSKRTAMYGTWARISNKGSTTTATLAGAGAAFVIPGGSGAALGAKSTGYEVGLRHSF